MTKRHLLLALFLGLGACCAPVRAQAVQTTRGTVEFIGLRSWTPETISLRLGYDSPAKLHFCAAVLKEKLGFAEASVIHHIGSDTDPSSKDKLYTVITVVEPGDSTIVQYKPNPTKSLPIPAGWATLSDAIDQLKFDDVTFELQFYASIFKVTDSVDTGSKTLQEQRPSWWNALKQLSDKRDYSAASKVLLLDKDSKRRSIAAMVLTNFAGRDEAWWALMECLRDSNNGVREICRAALFTLTKHVPRTVDWSGAKRSVRHLLNGTNLFALPQVLRTLFETNISHRLAKPLLRDGGGRMLLPYLSAKHQVERTLSHSVLTKLLGRDLGHDRAHWAEWLDSID
jgi:hypothetical protein